MEGTFPLRPTPTFTYLFWVLHPPIPWYICVHLPMYLVYTFRISMQTCRLPGFSIYQLSNSEREGRLFLVLIAAASPRADRSCAPSPGLTLPTIGTTPYLVLLVCSSQPSGSLDTAAWNIRRSTPPTWSSPPVPPPAHSHNSPGQPPCQPLSAPEDKQR